MAGLAAIQTAKNMGAVVLGYDVRPVVQEQVESMGGQFLKARSRRPLHWHESSPGEDVVAGFFFDF